MRFSSEGREQKSSGRGWYRRAAPAPCWGRMAQAAPASSGGANQVELDAAFLDQFYPAFASRARCQPFFGREPTGSAPMVSPLDHVGVFHGFEQGGADLSHDVLLARRRA